jgi:tRNA 2-thiouridine synthesizing protein A
MTEPDPAYILDVRGLLCVQVLLRLRRWIEALAPPATMHVVTDDPAAPLDLPAWCHLAGHHYLGLVASPLGTAYGIQIAEGDGGGQQPALGHPALTGTHRAHPSRSGRRRVGSAQAAGCRFTAWRCARPARSRR